MYDRERKNKKGLQDMIPAVRNIAWLKTFCKLYIHVTLILLERSVQRAGVIESIANSVILIFHAADNVPTCITRIIV